MAQVRLAYPEIKQRGAELFQITPTPAAQAALYARRFDLPFPYLCDADRATHRRYGLTAKGVLASLKAGLESLPGVLAGSMRGEQPSPLPYMAGGLASGAMEQGMFLVGRDGCVRFRHIADIHAHVPSNDTLLRALDVLSSPHSPPS